MLLQTFVIYLPAITQVVPGEWFAALCWSGGRIGCTSYGTYQRLCYKGDPNSQLCACVSANTLHARTTANDRSKTNG